MFKVIVKGVAYKGLDGEVLMQARNPRDPKSVMEPIYLGRVIGNTLDAVEDGDALRLSGLAEDFYNKDVVEISEADLKFVKDHFKSAKLRAGLRRQIIDLLESATEKSATKAKK